MATITIKIDSEQLAREVLTQLGYLPGEDDDIPDLISIESEDEEPEVKEKPKSVVRHMDNLPVSTRNIPVPKQNEFCTTEESKEDVEPVENEIGASLATVYSDDAKKESDALYQQCLEVRKSIPSTEDRFKAQVDELWGCERLDYLDAMADHSDKEMREAVNAYVLREYIGHDLKMWPSLQKIIDDATRNFPHDILRIDRIINLVELDPRPTAQAHSLRAVGPGLL